MSCQRSRPVEQKSIIEGLLDDPAFLKSVIIALLVFFVILLVGVTLFGGK